MSDEITEKVQATQVVEDPSTAPSEKRPESSEQEHEKPEQVTTSSIEDREEPVPHLHAKTFLTVFAVCLIYFAQLINVVGAGAVRIFRSLYQLEVLLTLKTRELKIFLTCSAVVPTACGLLHPSLSLQPFSVHRCHKQRTTGEDDGS
jgi:hypothetical protein